MILRYSLLGFAVGVFLVTIGLLSVPASSVDDQAAPSAQAQDAKQPGNKKIAMKAFMRTKLESSQSVLEGLAVEDFDLIAKGAKKLNATSAAAEFMVVDDPLYTQYAAEFRSIIDKMGKAAKEKRLDGATLAYMDMTMSCVECHKYVRNVLIAQ